MELQFNKNEISYLDHSVSETQNSEQTQEIKLSDGMPDIGSILGTWGQIILRSKEWLADRVTISGGMMAWVLYRPEEEGCERMIYAWIPFQMKWDLPEHLPEGKNCVDLRVRFMDARTVSPRKIIVRVGIAGHMDAYSEKLESLFEPVDLPDHVAVLEETNTVLLPQEAGEATFLVDEDLTSSSMNTPASSLIAYNISPEISDKKVLGNKTAFRGNINLHVVYRTTGDKVESQNFQLPFSQYAQLENTYGTDAEVNLTLSPTNLELELNDDGRFHVKSGLTAQYLIGEQKEIKTIADAYCPYKAVKNNTQMLQLPMQTEQNQVNIYGEMTLPSGVNDIADISILPDYPSMESLADQLRIQANGPAQVLYYDNNGVLQSTASKWEGSVAYQPKEGSTVNIRPLRPQNGQILLVGNQSLYRMELPLEITEKSPEGITEISSIELDETGEPDAGRPSVILRRAQNQRLWDLAKEYGSTVEAIKMANHLEGEPDQGQMLLIPIA